MNNIRYKIDEHMANCFRRYIACKIIDNVSSPINYKAWNIIKVNEAGKYVIYNTIISKN